LTPCGWGEPSRSAALGAIRFSMMTGEPLKEVDFASLAESSYFLIVKEARAYYQRCGKLVLDDLDFDEQISACDFVPLVVASGYCWLRGVLVQNRKSSTFSVFPHGS
jgi:hypothetical protein